MKERINQLVEAHFDSIIAWRHWLHQHPELSNQEAETETFLCGVLDQFQIPYKRGIAGHGICATIQGGKPGKTIMIRADMDALPLEECTGLPFSSVNSGVMHACGHDANMVNVLGAAIVLNELKGELSGTVKAVFQPDEEVSSGARRMVQEGLLKKHGIDAAIAGHLNPDLMSGTIGICPGPAIAEGDAYYVTLNGTGGHAAKPDKAVDPIVMGADFVMQLQTVVSRRVSPLEPAVVTVGSFQAGTTTNIIPDCAKLMCSVRTLTEEMSLFIEREIRRTLDGVTTSHNGSYEIKVVRGYPPVVNDEAMVELGRQVCGEIIGADKVVVQRPEMTSEDFAFFAREVPSLYFLIGTQEKGGQVLGLHNANFTFQDHILKNVIKCFCGMAMRYAAGS